MNKVDGMNIKKRLITKALARKSLAVFEIYSFQENKHFVLDTSDGSIYFNRKKEGTGSRVSFILTASLGGIGVSLGTVIEDYVLSFPNADLERTIRVVFSLLIIIISIMLRLFFLCKYRNRRIEDYREQIRKLEKIYKKTCGIKSSTN